MQGCVDTRTLLLLTVHLPQAAGVHAAAYSWPPHHLLANGAVVASRGLQQSSHDFALGWVPVGLHVGAFTYAQQSWFESVQPGRHEGAGGRAVPLEVYWPGKVTAARCYCDIAGGCCSFAHQGLQAGLCSICRVSAQEAWVHVLTGTSEWLLHVLSAWVQAACWVWFRWRAAARSMQCADLLWTSRVVKCVWHELQCCTLFARHPFDVVPSMGWQGMTGGCRISVLQAMQINPILALFEAIPEIEPDRTLSGAVRKAG